MKDLKTINNMIKDQECSFDLVSICVTKYFIDYIKAAAVALTPSTTAV